MDSQRVCISVRPILELDHKKFVEGLNFNGSYDNKLEVLMKVTTYFRSQVIPLYQDFAQTLSGKSALLKEKRTYMVEDLVKLNEETEKMVYKFQPLFEKCNTLRKKQNELLKRAETLVRLALKYRNSLSDAENWIFTELCKCNEKLKTFRESIDVVHGKNNIIEMHEAQQNTGNSTHYFHDTQVQIIKDSVCTMSLKIEQIIDKILLIDNKLNEELLIDLDEINKSLM